jgi:hypothetical protein
VVSVMRCAAMQADEDMRRYEPWLWHFANVVTWAIHPWVSLRLWWRNREGCWTSPQNGPRIPYEYPLFVGVWKVRFLFT